MYPIIGIGAGIATALLIASTTMGGLGLRMLVYLLAPLPLVLTGLGLGSTTAAIAAGTSALLVLFLLGPQVAALHAVSHGIPITVLTYLALLSREQPRVGADVLQASPAIEWYPVGRLVAATTIMAAIHGVLSTVVLGIDLDQQRQVLRQFMQIFAERLPRPDGKVLTEDEIGTLVELGIYTLPAAAALSWMLGTLLNFYVGARITAASGQLIRPLPDIPSMTFPAGFSLGLAASLPLAFVGGMPGFIGAAFTGAFFCAHLLMGLAIIHDVSRGATARPAILAGLYAALLVLNTWTAIGLAIFAALAPLLRLKRGKIPPAAKPD